MAAVFRGKTALVTGASRGIGAAVARRLARDGADLVLNYRKEGGASEKGALELKAELESLGRSVSLVRADISKKDDVRAMMAAVAEGAGRLDFLVLNAARAPFKPFHRLFERELRQLVETNYLGNIFCIQQALPMLEASGGRVVFVSSLGSRFYNPSYPLGSMKAAMESVVRDCAEEFASRGVGFNAVCGGLVRTDSYKVLRRLWEGLDAVPEEMFVEPEEIADVVSFLCSPGSRGLRGQTIVVDRGLGNSLFGRIGGR